MLMSYKRTFLIVLAVMIGFALVVSFAARPATAQEPPARMRALLESLRDGEVSLTLEFARPLVSGESTWTLPDETVGRRISQVGEDYVCFSEPWNDTFRERCTPFSNLVTMTFVK